MLNLRSARHGMVRALETIVSCRQPKNQPESDRFLGPSYLLPIYPHKLHIKSTRKRSLSWLFLSTPHIHAINIDTGSCPRQVIPTRFVSRVQITLNMTRHQGWEPCGSCRTLTLVPTRHDNIRYRRISSPTRHDTSRADLKFSPVPRSLQSTKVRYRPGYYAGYPRCPGYEMGSGAFCERSAGSPFHAKLLWSRYGYIIFETSMNPVTTVHYY